MRLDGGLSATLEITGMWAYTNELEDADIEQFDYEYLGYCERSELERVIG